MREGEKNGRAKLKTKQVREIREYWELFKGRREPIPGAHNNRIVSAQKLAKQYRVAISTMQSILDGKTWPHVKVQL